MIIFSQKMASYLMWHGFVLQEIRRSYDNKRNVFIFNDSDEIKQKMDRFNNFKVKFEDCLYK